MQLKIGHSRDPFDWIYIAKGIGIILVVVGHFDPEISPNYWITLWKMIYSFHMPLFFILSGYLFIHGKYSYVDLIKTKSKRLLYPFISIAGIFFLIKYVAGYFVRLGYPVNVDSVYALLIDPAESYIPPLWFVHTLFFIFAFYPFARLFLNNLSILLLLLIIDSVFGSCCLFLGKVMSNMPFFLVGIILRENVKLSKIAIGDNISQVFSPIAMFFLAYAILDSVNIMSKNGYSARFFLGIVGSLSVINLSCAISNFSDMKIKKVLLKCGYYSVSVYLFHTLFESTVRIMFFQLLKDVLVPFELVAFVAITCGIIVPLELEKQLLRRFGLTRKFVLGLG